MELIFATNNKNKFKEIDSILDSSIDLKDLSAINCNVDIPETGDTIEANATQKANYVVKNYNVNCFADDTGLEVDALNGEPGVYSARYASDKKDAKENMKLVLHKLSGVENRKARFKTVISLFLNNQEYQFEGVVNGTITDQPCGDMGFGYDPIFKPDGYDKTFAQLESDIKNKISHRAIAVRKLVDFLKQS